MINWLKWHILSLFCFYHALICLHRVYQKRHHPAKDRPTWALRMLANPPGGQVQDPKIHAVVMAARRELAMRSIEGRL